MKQIAELVMGILGAFVLLPIIGISLLFSIGSFAWEAWRDATDVLDLVSLLLLALIGIPVAVVAAGMVATPFLLIYVFVVARGNDEKGEEAEQERDPIKKSTIIARILVDVNKFRSIEDAEQAVLHTFKKRFVGHSFDRWNGALEPRLAEDIVQNAVQTGRRDIAKLIDDLWDMEMLVECSDVPSTTSGKTSA